MYYTSRQQEWFNLIIYSETIVCNIPKTTFFFWSTSFTISIMLCSTCFNMSLSCRMFSSIGWGVSRGRPLNVLEPAYSNSLHEPTFFSLLYNNKQTQLKKCQRKYGCFTSLDTNKICLYYWVTDWYTSSRNCVYMTWHYST